MLTRLVRDKRVKPREVEAYLADLTREIDDVEKMLLLLRDTMPGTSARASRPGSPPKRRLKNLSPARRAALKLQGHYVALMRQAPASRRAGFTALFKKKGAQAAIDALRKLLGK